MRPPTIVPARFVGGLLDGELRGLEIPQLRYQVAVVDVAPTISLYVEGAMPVPLSHTILTYELVGQEPLTGHYLYRLNGDPQQFPPVLPSSDEGPGMLLEELLGEIDDCLEGREE